MKNREKNEPERPTTESIKASTVQEIGVTDKRNDRIVPPPNHHRHTQKSGCMCVTEKVMSKTSKF